MSEWVSAWVCEWMSVWMSERVRVWLSEWMSRWGSRWWVSEWVSISEWAGEWVSISDKADEWVSEWVSEWAGEWVDRWGWLALHVQNIVDQGGSAGEKSASFLLKLFIIGNDRCHTSGPWAKLIFQKPNIIILRWIQSNICVYTYWIPGLLFKDTEHEI